MEFGRSSMLFPQEWSLQLGEVWGLFCLRHKSYPKVPAGQDSFWTGWMVTLQDWVNRMFYWQRAASTRSCFHEAVCGSESKQLLRACLRSAAALNWPCVLLSFVVGTEMFLLKEHVPDRSCRECRDMSEQHVNYWVQEQRYSASKLKPQSGRATSVSKREESKWATKPLRNY